MGTKAPTAPADPQQDADGPPEDLLSGLRLSDDMVQVLLTCTVPDEVEPFIASTMDDFSILGIVKDSQVAKAKAVLTEHAKPGAELVELVLLEGKPQVPTIQGRIAWTRDFFKKGFYVDPETGNVDYRKPAAEAVVSAGDMLAKVEPPVPGEPGRDVFNDIVQPDPPESAIVRAGQHVRGDEDTFYAETDGLVHFAEGVLSVDDVRVVNGSIGLQTGHVDHPGALIVEENIDTGSVVNASGDIQIDGYAEGADITVGGDLVVNGGIIGEEGKKIIVDGNLQARFIKNADIEVAGDVNVVSAVENCTIRCNGTLRVTSGRVVGGDVQAVNGIDADEIGSEAYITTTLTVGHNARLSKLLEEWTTEVEEIEEKLSKVDAAIETLESKTESLNHAQREAMTTAIHQIDGIRFRRDVVKKDVKETKVNAKEHKGILARKRLFPGASVTLGRLTGKVKEEFPGPIRVAVHKGDIGYVRANLR